jgi:predicted TIM-barrel fold metal-dependent hydrolase
MQVVDPHIHFWDLEVNHYPWLTQPGDIFIGDYSSIAKTYLLQHFLEDSGSVDVVKLVHIDAGHDPGNPVGETRWLQAIADDPSSRGRPNAIIGSADFSKEDVEATLEAHAESPNFRGIRQILNVHPDKRLDYVGRHYMTEPAWHERFKLLAKYNLIFDLQIYPHQMLDAARLAAENPGVPIVLNHTGMFADRKSVEGWRIWRDGMRALARQPNVSVKISGMGMLDHHWTSESIRPYALETIEAFGVSRCMFASNFPVDRLYSSYEALWTSYADIVADMTEDEQVALFRRNAEQIYRI